MIRSYRPPENIINDYYDTKSEIWVVGCILYELLNGCSLFDMSDFVGSDIEKDRFSGAFKEALEKSVDLIATEKLRKT